MGEARLCIWLLGDGGNLGKFKWIQRNLVSLCKSHTEVGQFNAETAENQSVF